MCSIAVASYSAIMHAKVISAVAGTGSRDGGGTMAISRAQRLLVCLLLCEGLLGGRTVLAQSITFIRVADTNTPIPGGTGSFTALDRHPSMRGGNVAFRAEGSDGQVGAYTEISGVLGLVADTNTPIPGGSGSFTEFGASLGGSVSFDGLNVVFRGLGSSDQDGVYTDEGGTLRIVADTNTPIPGGTGNFAGFRFDPSIDSGSTAFAGGDTTGPLFRGVYTEIGGALSVVADSSTPVPGGTGNFSSFDIVSMDGTDMAFRAFAPGFLGLITHIDGVFNVVMDRDTPIPGDTGNFTLFGAATLDGGNVVFLGGKASDLTGVYTDLGGTLRVVADKNTPVPLGTGNFTSFFFGPVAAIDNGNIAFMGARFSSSGMYAEMQGSLMKVVDETDTLGTESTIWLDGGPEALGGNEVAFWAEFSDGSEAIFVATIPLDVCGNGILEAGEECDGQGESADCDSDCTFAECGDGTVNPSAGEACDDGAANSDTVPGACPTDCALPRCGNGVIDPEEGCDDGNTIDGDGCQGNCQLPVCGDGIVDAFEECDDGNTINDDACRNNCRLPRCGDGVVDAGEACDDGPVNSDTHHDSCRLDCTLPRCGDGVVDSGEACDDSNQIDGDGCSSTCEVEGAGEAVPTVSQWGLTILSLLLGVGGKVYFRRRGPWQRIA